MTLDDISRDLWLLDPVITFLNHGSFGACPRAVLDEQTRWRERLEREPVRFLVRELEPLLDVARERLGRLVGARTEDLAFVPNATTAVNAVAQSLVLEPGDEILTHGHAYNACANALRYWAERQGARLVVADVPFPLASADDVVAAVLDGVTNRTRLVMLDHVTSPTGLVLPVERLVPTLEERGVPVLVDGAHAVGMLPLELDRLGASYYTANCHKWLCTPKGSAFLHARRDRQVSLRPAIISHGSSSRRTDRSRFLIEFDWTGTADPTPFLCLGAGIDFLDGLLPGGLPALMRRNRALALAAREVLIEALGVPKPAPDEMIGALAAVPLPDGDAQTPGGVLGGADLQARLLDRGFELPIIAWPQPPRRLLRVAAAAYNHLEEYRRLARSLVEELRLERGSASGIPRAG